MNGLVCTLLNLYLIAIFGRVILSWFPLSPNSPMAGIFTFLWRVTEPVLAPLRRILPPTGGIDFSPMVVMFGVFILQGALC